ncbi:MAG: hypothetical protein KJO27_00760 [Gammaproteobacteria bacterium]|nr:hypothetical protein [Gammaproteobacteria bacterium]NNL43930.1 hypothetical protein [Woeseiaceae bacterium]
MAKHCGVLQVGAVQGGGTVGASTVQGNRVVSSFEVPVAIEYELTVGDRHFKKIRCCEPALAPFIAENHGNEVCIYTFKQIPRTDVMLAVTSKDGPSYQMTSGRMYLTIFAQIFLVLIVGLPLLLIPVIGWILSPLAFFFTGKYVLELYSTWQTMNKDG